MTFLIIHHSRTGGSRQMAEASAEAARSETRTALVEVSSVTEAQMLDARGYLFCGPENLAALSGAMKEMFDRLYYPLLGRIEGRPYAHMVCAGSDGEGAARQLQRIATGWRLTQVQPPLIVNTRADTPEAILAPKIIREADLGRCRDLGAALAAGIEMGAF